MPIQGDYPILSLLTQIIGTGDNLDSLWAGLLLAAFFILLLPPLVATVTGIVCGLTILGGKAWWGGAVGLALGLAGAIINIAGLSLILFGYLYFDPRDWALENLCPKDRYWYNLDHDSTCRRALKWADEVFWVGISFITPAVAAAGTWWLCRRRSMGRR